MSVVDTTEMQDMQNLNVKITPLLQPQQQTQDQMQQQTQVQIQQQTQDQIQLQQQQQPQQQTQQLQQPQLEQYIEKPSDLLIPNNYKQETNLNDSDFDNPLRFAYFPSTLYSGYYELRYVRKGEINGDDNTNKFYMYVPHALKREMFLKGIKKIVYKKVPR